MINDKEFLCGAAFLRLLNSGQPVTITHDPAIHSSVYLVSTPIKHSGVLFKISTKSRPSWFFTFSAQEDRAINHLKQKYPNIGFFVALVCHKDGICCLSEPQLRSVFNLGSSSFIDQRVSVSRKSSGSYHISGANRVLMGKAVPQNAWPKLVI